MAERSDFDRASELHLGLLGKYVTPSPELMAKALECIELFKQVIDSQQEAYRKAIDQDCDDLVAWLDRNTNDPVAASHQGVWGFSHHKHGGTYAVLCQSCPCCVKPGTFYSTDEYDSGSFATAREALEWAKSEGDMWDKIHRKKRTASPPTEEEKAE